jgi:hypothetical protein
MHEMRKLTFGVIFFLLVFSWQEQAFAKRTITVKIGKGEAVVAFLDGAAQVLSEGQEKPRSLKVNDVLKKGDEVSTGAKSKLELVLPDKTQLRFSDNSNFKIVQIDAGYDQAKDVKVHVAIGKAWANVSKAITTKQNFELTCENAVAGVRGTVYRMDINEDKSALVRVYDGTVHVAGGGKALEAPKVIGPPRKVEGPKPIAGPKKVSMEEWTFIIKSMQQIMIRGDGTPEKPKNFTEQEDRDAWVDWNKSRDGDELD